MKKRLKLILNFIVIISFLCFIGCSKQNDINVVYSNLDNARSYELAEYGIRINNLDDKINYYDSSDIILTAIITSPSGKTYNVPMFYYEECERRLEGSRENIINNGNGQFRFRFTPLEEGKYTYYINIVICGVVSRYPNNESNTFVCQPGNKNAFLKVSSDNMRLEFSNGQPFVGIGNNYCGWEWAGVDNMGGTYDYEKWFYELNNNGANMTQFDLCEGDQIEWTYSLDELNCSDEYEGIGIYSQKMSYKTDYKVQLADYLGLFYRFTIFHWEDFDVETDNFPDWGWSRNPYNSKNGGYVNNVSEFFTNQKAKDAVKNYLRYIIARWGYSTSLMVYELWNEVDSPDIYWGGKSYSSNINDIKNWHDEMAKYIKSLDVNKHLITTSFASSQNSQQIWALDSIDMTTYHRYTIYNGGGNEGYLETVKAIKSISDIRLNSIKKPCLAGEFALSPGGDVQREFDKEGIVFHNALYASIFSKNIGTAMSWNWGSYVDHYDLYYHYKAVDRMFANEDLTHTEAFDNLNVTPSNGNIWYMGLKNNNKAYLWIKDSMYDYVHTSNGYKETNITSGQIEINDLNDGKYIAIFINPYTNEIIDEEELEANNNKLILNYPSFTKDILVKIINDNDYYKSFDIYSGNDDSGFIPYSSYTIQKGNSIELYANGYDIGGTSDSGRFAYVAVNGDFEYTVRLDKTNYSANGAKAGIMFRDDFSSSAKMMFVGCYNNCNFISLYRKMPGLPSGFDNYGSGYLNCYLRIKRIGNIVESYISFDGIEYTKLSSVSYDNLNDQLYIGCIAANKNTLGYNEAIFSNITLTRNN